jgi:hypothetical protein
MILALGLVKVKIDLAKRSDEVTLAEEDDRAILRAAAVNARPLRASLTALMIN